MTTSADELHELRTAVRRAIGAGEAEDPPEPRAGWRASWPELAAMGVAGFCVPAELGGFGDEVEAAFVVSREMGWELHGSPYPGVVAAAHALSRWLPGAEREAVAAAVLQGEEVPTVARLHPSSTVDAGGDGVRVHGRARLVLGAEDADSLVVLGPGGSMAYVRDGWVVGERDEFDVTRSCAEVVLDGAAGLPLTAPDPAAAQGEVERLLGLLLAADALGGVERCHERTVGYARQRTAFGKPIGGFQAVQHRLVDHAVTLRGLARLAEAAARALTEGTQDATRLALLAQAGVGGRALHVLHDLVQLTGGVGFTWEYGLHLYERRAHLDARLCGNPRAARRGLVVSEGWARAEGAA